MRFFGKSKKILKIFSGFITDIRYCGFRFAFWNMLWWLSFYIRTPFSFRLSQYAIRKKTCWLDHFFEKKYSDVLNRFRKYAVPENRVPGDKIWVFWDRGFDSMPPLAKACYKQLCYLHDNVVLLTVDNLSEYVILSPVIIEKYRRHQIGAANFSDIIRNTLLAQYGGLWLDATVWVPGHVFEKLKDFSIYTACGKVVTNSRSICFWTSFEWNWSSWCLYAGHSGEFLFSYVSELLQAAAEREEHWPDYVLQDYLIYSACRKFPEVAKSLSECMCMPCQNRNMLADKLSEPWQESAYCKLIEKDNFLKLSCRVQYSIKTADGRDTFYGKLLSAPFKLPEK